MLLEPFQSAATLTLVLALGAAAQDRGPLAAQVTAAAPSAQHAPMVPAKPAPAVRLAGTPFYESGVSRWGGDIAVLPLPERRASLCRQACLTEDACLSWTYVHPLTPDGPALCRLKGTVAPASRDACCISGVRIGAGEGGPLPVPVRPLPASEPAPQAEDVTDAPAQTAALSPGQPPAEADSAPINLLPEQPD